MRKILPALMLAAPLLLGGCATYTKGTTLHWMDGSETQVQQVNKIDPFQIDTVDGFAKDCGSHGKGCHMIDVWHANQRGVAGVVLEGLAASAPIGAGIAFSGAYMSPSTTSVTQNGGGANATGGRATSSSSSIANSRAASAARNTSISGGPRGGHGEHGGYGGHGGYGEHGGHGGYGGHGEHGNRGGWQAH